jgi:membrane-associated PAP2 superfamily phosphatase
MTFRRAALILAVCALGIALLGGLTHVDMDLARAMAGPGPSSFPLRHNWWTATVGHVFVKNVMIVLGLCAVLPALADVLRPRRRWTARFRSRLRVLALAAVLVPLVVSLLKQASSSHCPWDLIDFGGAEAYVRLFEAPLPGASLGQCMPAGHASAGLWLVALAVFWLPERPRLAGAVGAAMLALGFAMGWVQQLRGAHFLSHTLWSMWIACAIVTVLWHCLYKKENASGLGVPR